MTRTPPDARRSGLPDLETLTEGLAAILDGAGPEAARPVVVEREANAYGPSARSEIVTCRTPDGRRLRLLCKYETGDLHSSVAYEADVYRHVLPPLGVTAPAFHGSFTEGVSGRAWLVLEYLDDMTPLDELFQSDVLEQAAAWLGRFHAAGEVWLARSGPSFLKVYDGDYYRQHAERAAAAGDTGPEAERISVAADRFAVLAAALPAPRPTVVHGDFYVHNVLVRDGAICVVDWEAAGVDLGEADLACLTDGLSKDDERRCERAYCAARWPGESPADFASTLALARLCLYFYHLGTRPGWTADEQGLWYSRRLRRLGEQMGLM
jgi:hypothetical protein